LLFNQVAGGTSCYFLLRRLRRALKGLASTVGWHVAFWTNVIERDGTVGLAFVDDYRNRLEPTEILAVLPAVSREGIAMTKFIGLL
jgi:hypothetical protein